MKTLLTNSFLVISILLASMNASATDRDPFSPSGGAGAKTPPPANNQASATAFSENNPLTSTALNGFKIVGVMISDNQRIASVKAINGISYLVKVGDSLGSEGGKVSAINIDEITVQTQSDNIKLPVSNKVEVPLDAQSTKKN